MTAEELIEELEELPPNSRVFTSGYEGGYEDATEPGDPRSFCLDVHTAWFYGPHVHTDDLICQKDRDDYERGKREYDEPCNHERVEGVVL